MAISGMPVIGRHTKIGHGHLLNVWKAPEGQDTLEISHDSGSHTESPENPVELGNLGARVDKILLGRIAQGART